MGRGEILSVCLILEAVDGTQVVVEPFEVVIRIDGGRTISLHKIALYIFLPMLLSTEESLDNVVIHFDDIPIQVPATRCGSVIISRDSELERGKELTLYVAEIQLSFLHGDLTRDFPVNPPTENATIAVLPDSTSKLIAIMISIV